jgi:hypothetical protein
MYPIEEGEHRKMTAKDTAHLAAGQTLNVTIEVEGHDPSDGRLTVVEVVDDDVAQVENGNGDRMNLSYFTAGSFSGGDHPSLIKHGDVLATVTALDVVNDE